MANLEQKKAELKIKMENLQEAPPLSTSPGPESKASSTTSSPRTAVDRVERKFEAAREERKKGRGRPKKPTAEEPQVEQQKPENALAIEIAKQLVPSVILLANAGFRRFKVSELDKDEVQQLNEALPPEIAFELATHLVGPPERWRAGSVGFAILMKRFGEKYVASRNGGPGNDRHGKIAVVQTEHSAPDKVDHPGPSEGIPPGSDRGDIPGSDGLSEAITPILPLHMSVSG